MADMDAAVPLERVDLQAGSFHFRVPSARVAQFVTEVAETIAKPPVIVDSTGAPEAQRAHRHSTV